MTSSNSLSHDDFLTTSETFCGPMGLRSQTLLASFSTVSDQPQLVKRGKHPATFASTYSRILTQSFDCQFIPAECDPQTHSPLSFFVEHLVYATGLPFSVTIASLIILQRLYTHLPSAAFNRRSKYSAHRLFAGAYMAAARQYFYTVARTLEHAHLRAPGLFDVFTATDRSSPILSDTYWADLTTYDPSDIQEIQKALLIALGCNIAVFPVTDPPTEEYIKMNALPKSRHVPARVRNLSRMTTEDQYEYFISISRKPDWTQQSTGPAVAWWKNRSISYP